MRRCGSTFPVRAGSSTTRRRSGPPCSPPPRRRLATRAPGPESPRSGSRTSARPRCSGSARRARRCAGDRLAGPADCRALPGAPRELIRERTGSRPGSLFLGYEARVAPPRGGRRPGRARLRHRRLLARLATDRRRGSRHRRLERLAHDALGLESLEWDDELLALFGVPRRSCRGSSTRAAGLRRRTSWARGCRSPESRATSRRRSSARVATSPDRRRRRTGRAASSSPTPAATQGRHPKGF